jgi:protein phosphatase
MLARLKGMMQSLQPGSSAETERSPVPIPDSGAATGTGTEETPPLALPVTPPTQGDWHDVPVAVPVEQTEQSAETIPVAEPVFPSPPHQEGDIPVAEAVAEHEPPPETEPAASQEAARLEESVTVSIPCRVCGTPRQGSELSCRDCGYYFSPADFLPSAVAAEPDRHPVPAASRLRDRYELRECISERFGVRRYQGLDHGESFGRPVSVVVIEQDAPINPPTADAPPAALEIVPETRCDAEDEFLPGFDEVLPAASPITEVLPPRPAWPSITWERGLLSALEESALPRILDSFAENGKEYLVEEVPTGRSLWDAWDDPETTSEMRFGWLVEVAETLHHLHQCGGLLEGLRPDLILIGEDGHARITDLGDLLPLPLLIDAPVRGSLYTAPELTGGASVDARADLYSFGALLYALHVGRELSEIDFDRPGNPKPFVPRFPDVHPAFGRLLTKTFRRDPASRFPTDEAGKEDPSGFLELIRTLRVLGRTLDNVRLEIASWTTTGIVRTGNEDAFALLHACETRQDDCAESALVILCDGMGGYEAGEVAAALAIQVLRKNLTAQKPFAALTGASAFPDDAQAPGPHPDGHLGPPINVEEIKQLLRAALKEANRTVYTASRAPGSKRRGMGCTAEVVYMDGRNVIVGHVGDSRTYHLHEGRLIQLTRDQTLVNRLVELGQMTPEEAETSNRRNELQQAIGGQPDVEPGIYHGDLMPGDWVLVCSDGVTNHVSANDLKMMLQSEAQSAEMAARRLVNLVNIEGATDNATVVVVRAT